MNGAKEVCVVSFTRGGAMILANRVETNKGMCKEDLLFTLTFSYLHSVRMKAIGEFVWRVEAFGHVFELSSIMVLLVFVRSYWPKSKY